MHQHSCIDYIMYWLLLIGFKWTVWLFRWKLKSRRWACLHLATVDCKFCVWYEMMKFCISFGLQNLSHLSTLLLFRIQPLTLMLWSHAKSVEILYQRCIGDMKTHEYIMVCDDALMCKIFDVILWLDIFI